MDQFITKPKWREIFKQYGITREQFEQTQKLWLGAPCWGDGDPFSKFNPWVGAAELDKPITESKIVLFYDQDSRLMFQTNNWESIMDVAMPTSTEFVNVASLAKPNIREMEF